MGLSFAEGEGPRFARAARDESEIRALAVPDMNKLAYVFDAIGRVKHALDGRVPLIGFAGSPFTLACYMIEGGASADFATVRAMAYRRPDLLAHLTALNARAVTAYLNEQIAAGVDAVMLFDTWGGLLSASHYRQFSLAPMRDVLAGLSPAGDGRRIPSIVFTKGGGSWLDEIASCGADGVGLDWTVDIAAARTAVGARVALQGNLDPLVLLTDPVTVAREASAIVRAAGPAPGHIFNLGHGIVPATKPDNVAALVEAVHTTSRETRAPA
jgi:uroporphyrinogen decarboxylase